MQRKPRLSTEVGRARLRTAGSVHVARSRTGKGVFAKRRFKPNETIGEILGTLIQDAQYGSDYCFRIGENTCLEPESPFRFINHSCEPNCEFDWFDIVSTGETAPRKRVLLFAMSVIKPDDQLTIDYNWSAAAAIPCRCQAASCRGWVVDINQSENLGRTEVAPRQAESGSQIV